MAKYGLHSSPGPLLRRTHQIGMSIFADRFNDIDITPLQFSILWVLNQHPEIDQATLAKAVALDRMTCSNMVTRMEHKGLIDRKTDPENRRAKLLTITRQGEQLLSQSEAPMQQVQNELLKPLSKEERKMFLHCMTKIVDSHSEASRVSMRYLPVK